MKFIFIITSFLACTLSVKAQTYYYEAYLDGSKVGDIQAVREVNDESEKISITINVKFSESDGYQFDFASFSSYMDGKLIDSNSLIKINGGTTISEIIFKDGNYISNLSGNSRTLEASVLYGDDLLYFEKPDGLNKVYVLETDSIASLLVYGESIWQIDNGKNPRILTYTESALTSIAWKFADKQLVFKRKE